MKVMVRKIIIILFIATSLGIPMKIFAKIGVGIGTGKIKMDQKLKPGAIYDLPSVSIVNTGDEGSDYEVMVQYHNNIPELSPDRSWFSFKPQSFHLEPKESRVVGIALNLPVKTRPGDYFAYVEGRPVKTQTQEGGAKIGVAAAAKLYFTVQPANLLAGVLNKIVSYWSHYAPWTYIFVAVLVLAMIILLLKKFFSFNIGVQLKKKTKKKNSEQRKKRNKKDKSWNSDLFKLALNEVEEYTNTLSRRKQKQLSVEAKRHSKAVESFLQNGNSGALEQFSVELRRILMLSRKGLEQVEKQDKKIYKRLSKIITNWLLGDK